MDVPWTAFQAIAAPSKPHPHLHAPNRSDILPGLLGNRVDALCKFGCKAMHARARPRAPPHSLVHERPEHYWAQHRCKQCDSHQWLYHGLHACRGRDVSTAHHIDLGTFQRYRDLGRFQRDVLIPCQKCSAGCECTRPLKLRDTTAAP